MTQAAGEGVADLAVVRDVAVAPELAVVVTDEGRGSGGEFLVSRHIDLRRVIKVPVLLGRDEREVRLGHADGQEERLRVLLQLAQGLDREARDLAVGIGVVGHVGVFDRRPAGAALLIDVRRVVLHLEGGLRSVLGGLRVLRRDRPALRVVEPSVEDLAHAHAMVAVVLEILGHGHGVRQGGPEMRLQVPHARGVRSTAGHQRGARGAAHGLLAIGSVERGALGGDAVQVRGLDDVAAGRIDLGSQVIDRDEQDVQRFGLGGMRHAGEQAERQEGKGAHGGMSD